MHLRPAVILFFGLLALCGAGIAQEDVKPKTKSLYTPETAKAVEQALRWLATHQNADGSWSARVGFKINDGYRIQPDNQPDFGFPHLGVTSLAAMAFLSGGHLPGQGPYGKVMQKALSFVMSKVDKTGFITANGTRMYSHAFSLLFLSEVYGMTGNRDLREKLDRAVEFTHRSQNDKGGWRYAPLARDSDMSITVCQVVALREARNIGIKVPKETRSTRRSQATSIESAITIARADRGAFLYQDNDVAVQPQQLPADRGRAHDDLPGRPLQADRDVEAFAQKAQRMKKCAAAGATGASST